MIEMMQTTPKTRWPKAARNYGGLLLVLLTTVASGRVVPPPPPTLTLDDGKLLVNLARSGMVEFIKSRTPADKQILNPALKPLTKQIYSASVTLRGAGQLLSRSYRADANVCRSVLAAALDAMRSSNLPDRITPSVLARMTVEVEIHGKPRAISYGELGACIVQGLTGVTVSRGGLKGSVLPSTSCGMGLSTDQIGAVCLAQLPKSAGRAARGDAWSIFTSRHFVGYPDQTVVQLYRGKILIPPQAPGEKAFMEAATTAGLFLVTSQTAEGAYSGQNRKAAIHEHLYATYAMAKLSSRDKRKIFATSVDRALKYAARFVLADDKQARVLAPASGQGQTTESPTRATAWLLLTISELPPDPASRKLAEKLARALQQDVVSLVGPGDGMATRAQLGDRSVALLALRRFLPAGAESVRTLAPLVKTMRAWSQSGQTLSPLVFRGLGGAASIPKWRQIDDSDLPDRRGGFVSSRPEPTTFNTATAALCLQQSLSPARSPNADAAAVRGQILRARQFCRQMLYRSPEAYWTAEPGKMMGGLRISPASASVNLESCAAAIEAFLLQ